MINIIQTSYINTKQKVKDKFNGLTINVYRIKTMQINFIGSIIVHIFQLGKTKYMYG